MMPPPTTTTLTVRAMLPSPPSAEIGECKPYGKPLP